MYQSDAQRRAIFAAMQKGGKGRGPSTRTIGRRQTAAFTGVGTAAGSLFGGPVGAGVGAAAGYALGRYSARASLNSERALQRVVRTPQGRRRAKLGASITPGSHVVLFRSS